MINYCPEDEGPAESKMLVGFRVQDVLDTSLQFAARLLAITVEHIDNLITDWFPGLDTQTVQGHRLVTRLIPCPKCIASVSGVPEEPVDPPGKRTSQEKKQEGHSQTVDPLTDSGVGLSTTDGSSTSASPWPSPVHAMKKDATPATQNPLSDNLPGTKNSSPFHSYLNFSL